MKGSHTTLWLENTLRAWVSRRAVLVSYAYMVVFWMLAEDKEGPQGKGGETCETRHMAWLGKTWR